MPLNAAGKRVWYLYEVVTWYVSSVEKYLHLMRGGVAEMMASAKPLWVTVRADPRLITGLTGGQTGC